MFPGEFKFACEARRRVARIHRAVAIAHLRALTRRASFRIGFANDDRLGFQFGIRRDDFESVIHSAEVRRDAHANMVVGECRRTFGVEGDEVHGRSDLACGVICTAQTMFQKVACPLTTAACGVRSADACSRQCAAHTRDRVVMQFVEFLWLRFPIKAVRLVPHFPIPLLNFFFSVAFDAMFHPLINKLLPLRVILRRIRPASHNLFVTYTRIPNVLIGLRMNRHRFRHETDLRKRSHSGIAIRIEDTIQNRPVVDRIARCVFAINSG